MLKYLIQHAWLVLRTDGLITLIQEAIKYIGFYYPPHKIFKWWLIKLAGIKMGVREVQGSMMIFDLNDRGIHKDLFLNGIREPQATKYLQSILEHDWVVADIGANIGYYVLQEAKLAGEVIAIEPTPESFEIMSTNVALNEYDNVETHQFAIGDHNGQVGFDVSRACNWNAISKAKGDMGDIRVPIKTLDSLLNGQCVDFVRMDVEGYELSVLKGMEGLLRKHHPRMFIEVHRDKLKEYGYSQREFMEYLAQFGYSIEKSFIMGRESVTGRIDLLLRHKDSAWEITERGIASHIFFAKEVIG